MMNPVNPATVGMTPTQVASVVRGTQNLTSTSGLNESAPALFGETAADIQNFLASALNSLDFGVTPAGSGAAGAIGSIAGLGAGLFLDPADGLIAALGGVAKVAKVLRASKGISKVAKVRYRRIPTRNPDIPKHNSNYIPKRIVKDKHGLTPGDHVSVPLRHNVFKRIHHDGIYVGNGKVIEHGGKDVGIRKVSLHEFQNGKKIIIRKTPLRVSRREVVTRAHKALDPKAPYSPLLNNCQHVASRLRGGLGRSYDAERIAAKAGLPVGVAAVGVGLGLGLPRVHKSNPGRGLSVPVQSVGPVASGPIVDRPVVRRSSDDQQPVVIDHHSNVNTMAWYSEYVLRHSHKY